MNNVERQPALTQPIAREVIQSILNHSEPVVRAKSFISIRRIPSLFPVWLVLLGLSDFLFFGVSPGWTAGLFLLALVLATSIVNFRLFRSASKVVFLVAVCGLSVALIAQPGPLVMIMAVLGVISVAIVGRRGFTESASFWFRSWSRFVVVSWYQWMRDLSFYRRWKRSGHHSALRGGLKSGIGRWFLPLAFSSVFLMLFAIANPVIASWLNVIQQESFRVLAGLQVSVARIWFWFFAGSILWALLRFRGSKRTQAVAVANHGVDTSPQLITRCLALFNALFALQTVLDVRYLWAGSALPAGMSYAYYAHRGAYPLIVTALLAGIFVLATFRPETQTREMRYPRRLVYLWLAQNVFLVFSALWRLNIYVQTYSLSRWRIAAAIWMVLVAAGLCWIGMRIVLGRSNRWLVDANFATTVLVIYLCCFVNFDGMIAWYNVRHCREVTGQGVALDVDYLKEIGPEAIPPLQWLMLRTGNPNLNHPVTELKNSLRSDLTEWRHWTWRKQVLAQNL